MNFAKLHLFQLVGIKSRLHLNLCQNSQLLVDARAARTYRDEVDALRERAIKADKLESEVGRYKEQLHKMEFYKAKVEVDAVFLFQTVNVLTFILVKYALKSLLSVMSCSFFIV